MKKKIILVIVIVMALSLGIGTLLVPSINPTQKNSIRMYKPQCNPTMVMEFWKSPNNGFEFQEGDFSSSKNPRFIGKSKNENCKDLIIVEGKDESFLIRYSTPIMNENELDSSSMDNMKNLLKIMSSSIDNLDNMEQWDKKIKEQLHSHEDKYEVLDDNIISFYRNIYSNSLVLEIEKVAYHRYNNGEYKTS